MAARGTRDRRGAWLRGLVTFLMTWLFAWLMACLVGMVAITVASLSMLRSEMIDDRRQQVRNLVVSAASVAGAFVEKAHGGQMTEAEAKAAAAGALRAIRYGDGDYMFVIDGEGSFVMHPIKPELRAACR